MIHFRRDGVELTNRETENKSSEHFLCAGPGLLCALAMLIVVSGCQSSSSHSKPALPPTARASAGVTNDLGVNSGASMLLQEGDSLKISFPGAPNLDTIVTIRRDGKISLPLIGEYDASGKTPATLEADLKKAYASQIVNNEVSVNVQSSAFVVYVMGAVMRPGKLISDRPLTVLQALIEAGMDDSKSNLKKVEIFRTGSSGQTEKTTLNYYKFLHNKGAPTPAFTLKPYDVINVPEKFSWY